ncbi:MAG: C40 family peptidase [Proteobacteria bacterium]|nr:C40 family peptidase [Pseudomonadota bacterium]
MTSDGTTRPDKRTAAWREDLAGEELRGIVDVPRYVAGHEARVTTATLALRREPRPSAPLDTEALFGEAIRVLEVAGDWAWVQLIRDGYVGYVLLAGLGTPTEATHRVQALGTFVYPEPSIKVPPLMCLPLGARVAVSAAQEAFPELLTGGFIIGRHLAPVNGYARDFVDIAERFIGTPYLWGGRTRLGLDCSGLVQTSLEAAGIWAPRDSDMQEAALGASVLVPEDLEGLERGDLVFWKGHVGVMVDGVMLVHANAHHMAVAVEPLRGAADRIRRDGGRISAIKRLPALSARA